MLRVHIRNDHRIEGMTKYVQETEPKLREFHSCEYCGQYFQQELGLKNHIQNFHLKSMKILRPIRPKPATTGSGSRLEGMQIEVGGRQIQVKIVDKSGTPPVLHIPERSVAPPVLHIPERSVAPPVLHIPERSIAPPVLHIPDRSPPVLNIPDKENQNTDPEMKINPNQEHDEIIDSVFSQGYIDFTPSDKKRIFIYLHVIFQKYWNFRFLICKL